MTCVLNSLHGESTCASPHRTCHVSESRTSPEDVHHVGVTARSTGVFPTSLLRRSVLRMPIGRPTRVGYANVTSTLALIVALSGGAYAVATITGADVVDGSLRGVDVRDGSISSNDIANGSIRAADVRDGVIPPGPGKNLPAGVLVRGVFALNSGSPDPGSASAGQGVTFTNPPAAAPLVHIMEPAMTSAQCPGSVTNPTATSGHLCIYLRHVYGGMGSVILSSPEDLGNGVTRNVQSDLVTTFGSGRVSRLGFRMAVTSTSTIAQAEGTWALRG